jgi:uncharacterized Zn-binding protein involved in type VI secretion
MPAIAVQGGMSTGHGCFPPTQDVGPYTTTSFFDGKAIQLRGVTKYAQHSCGTSTHPDSARIVKDPGGSTFFLEGNPVAMIGDELTDSGDRVAKGSSNTFV